MREKLIDRQNLIFIIWGVVIVAISFLAYNISLKVKESLIYQGYIKAVDEVIVAAEECQKFPVFIGERRVNLINIDCLGQSQE